MSEAAASAAAAVAADQRGGEPATSGVLNRCFYMFDETLCTSEYDQENMLLYFHPDTSLENQMFLIGATSSLSQFAKIFTRHSPPQIIKLDHHKVAYKEVGSLGIALSGLRTEPDTTLLHDLETMYNAFVFFNGPVEHLRALAAGSVERFRALVRLGAAGLASLLHPPGGASRSLGLPLMPVLPPSRPNTRAVVQATQILASLRADTCNLGGCIFFDGLLLATDLAPAPTRLVLTGIEQMNAAAPMRHMMRDRGEAFTDVRTVYFNASFVGLLTLTLQGFAVGVLVQESAAADADHVRRLSRTIRTGLAGLGTLLVGSAPAAATPDRTASPVAAAATAASGASPSVSPFGATSSAALFSSLTLGGGASPSAVAPAPSGSAFFIYSADTTRGVGSATATAAMAEPDSAFAVTTAAAHDVFAQHVDASQIVLGNAAGVLYARNAYGREVFAMQPAARSPFVDVRTAQSAAEAMLLEHGHFTI